MESGYLKINVASVKDNRAAIYFKYNETAVSILKSAIPQTGRRFCRENKTWNVDIRSLPSLVKMFAECSVGGMYYECSSLITIYQKYCENNGIDNSFSRLEGMIPIQPELFDSKNTEKKKPYHMKEVLPSGYKDDPEISGFIPSIPEGSTFKPYPHQVSGAAILLKNHKYILADTMGLGKTFTAIMAAYGTEGRKLIITPASLKLNWRNEIMKFGIPEADICVISSKTVSEDLKNDAEWVIVNYDSLRCVHKEVFVSQWASDYSVVIFDEAHYCKAVNAKGAPGSIRSRLSLEIARSVPNVYLLTGTPITNKTKDIFILLKMVGSPLSKNWFAFANRYCGATRNSFGWEYDGSTNQEELNRRLGSCLLRRRIENILDMPQKLRSYIPVEADLRDYDRLLNKYLTSQDDDERTQAFAVLGKMKQAAALGKVEKTCALISDLLENGKSVVAYTCYLESADKICEKFGNDCVRITGDVSTAERQTAVEQFQSGEKKVIVCTVAAGGVGLTLTKSDVVVFNDFDYSAANMRQAEDRIWRIGQRNACSIFYIYADKCLLDETLCSMLDKKLSNMGKIIDGREEELITKEDASNQAILMKKLMEMKNSAQRKKRSKREQKFA
ncbi:MAG: DEAD/DEAH box helicase family protein [Anaerolineaceae bacterium]|nr:DEAD/DEAH box helicase family protein [Anaerolineaceae bacterium]